MTEDQVNVTVGSNLRLQPEQPYEITREKVEEEEEEEEKVCNECVTLLLHQGDKKNLVIRPKMDSFLLVFRDDLRCFSLAFEANLV